MRQLDLDVALEPAQRERFQDAAAQLGVTVGELLSAAASAYARRNAGASGSGGGALAPARPARKVLGWGARAAGSSDAERVPVRLGPEVLDVVEAVRRSVRWELPDGTTQPVTMEEYVAGAADRLLRSGRDAVRLAPELFPGRALPGAASPGPGALPSGGGGAAVPVPELVPLRWVLGGAAAVTLVALVVALVVAVRRPAPTRSVATTAVAVDAGPDAGGELRLGTREVPAGAPDAGTPGDARASAAALDRWEHQAEVETPRAGAGRPRSGRSTDHTQEIDRILDGHLGRGGGRQGLDASIAAAVRDVADLYPVPPALVKAIIRRESGFNPSARSRVGAIGLMQLMPFNARKVGLREADLWIPERNVLGGTRLIAALLRYYNGDMVAALAAYNAKPRNPFAPLPRNGETPEYVAAVLRYYDEYTRTDAARGGAPAP